MNIYRTLGLAAAVGAAFTSAAVQAQETAQTLGGSTVEGVCLLSREAIFANAAAGTDATSQLQAMASELQAEIAQEQQQLEAELEQLGVRQPIQADQLTEAQTAALQRAQALQQKAVMNNQQIEAVRQDAVRRISELAQPIIQQVYTSHGCGLLLDRNVVLGGNMANDLTAEVVAGLDAAVQSIPLERPAR